MIRALLRSREAVDAAPPQTRRDDLKERPAGSRKVHRHSLNALLQGGVQQGRCAGAPGAMRAARVSALKIPG